MDASTQHKHTTQALNASTKRKHITQALTLLPNASTKRKHTTQALTQALMGATRLASGKVQLLFSGACVFSFYFSDARRVAPIRGSVGCLRWVVALGA